MLHSQSCNSLAAFIVVAHVSQFAEEHSSNIFEWQMGQIFSGRWCTAGAFSSSLPQRIKKDKWLVKSAEQTFLWITAGSVRRNGLCLRCRAYNCGFLSLRQHR